MVNLNEINGIKDKEFKNLLLYFNSIYNITNKYFNKLMPNDNSNEQRFIKLELAKFLYKRLVTDELVNSFNISDDTKYRKQLEIIKNLLSRNTDADYIGIFQRLIWTEEGSKNSYDSLIRFIKSQNIPFINNMDTKINDFLANDLNWHALYYGKSKYLPLDDEIMNLKLVLDCENGGKVLPHDFPEFMRNYELSNPRAYQSETLPSLMIRYKSKRIGNIGEHFVYTWLNDGDCNPIWVAKDYGDGFGYDEYCFTTKEKIVESKATFNDRDSEYDDIRLSSDEHAVMCDCIDSKLREYYIFRTFIDKNNISYENRKGLMLVPQDENTLVSTYKDFPCTYNFDRVEDGKKVFVKKKNES